MPPVTGTYQFAGVHDDVATVEINGAYVYDVRSPSSLNWANAKGVSLTAGQRVPITVELLMLGVEAEDIEILTGANAVILRRIGELGAACGIAPATPGATPVVTAP